MRTLPRRPRRAFAIPLVLLLGVILMMFVFFLINNMTQSKNQKLATTHATKAYFMAQAGIQHMKLKYKLMPQEAFNSGFVQYGFNPWYEGVIDDFTAGGTKFPHFIATMGEDVTTRPESKAGDPELVKGSGVKQVGGFKGLPLSAGGFKLKDEDEDFSDGWGYDLVEIASASVRYDPPEKPTMKEQTIEYKIVGYAKQTLGFIVTSVDRADKDHFSPDVGASKKELAGRDPIVKWEARETLIIRTRFSGKDYGK